MGTPIFFHWEHIMKHLLVSLVAVALLSNSANAGLTYSQNFESLTPAQGAAPNDLSTDGWQVGGNVFAADGTFLYNYFSFPAPNGGPAFSGIVTGEGGAAQGANQLSIYNDYNNADHANNPTRRIEANVFRDIGVLDASDLGSTYTFDFDAKQGNISGATTASAFFRVIRTSGSNPDFATLASASLDTTAIGTNWSGNQLSLTIAANMVGETLQIGFNNTASAFADSGVFYDNLAVSAVPEPGSLGLLGLGSAVAFFRRRRT